MQFLLLLLSTNIIEHPLSQSLRESLLHVHLISISLLRGITLNTTDEGTDFPITTYQLKSVRYTHRYTHTQTQYQSFIFKGRTALLNFSHTALYGIPQQHLSQMIMTISTPVSPCISMNKIKSCFLNSSASIAVLGIKSVLNKHLLNEENHEVNKSN